MANFLRWVIGVVCNYNTRTGKVKPESTLIDPNEVMAGCMLLAEQDNFIEINPLEKIDAQENDHGRITLRPATCRTTAIGRRRTMRRSCCKRPDVLLFLLLIIGTANECGLTLQLEAVDATVA
jgi:hypothetical protein